MSKSLYILFILFLLNNLFAQNNRIVSMGGIDKAVKDTDLSLNLYDFGNNPAWLYQDEKQDWLKITPSFSGQNGKYRRYYDAQENNLYELNLTELKTLGKSGTFIGYTSYDYEERINVNRSLKYNTYAGEAFFFTDTTEGNVRYNGPKVGFVYSFELLHNLFIGANISYRILNGLKKIYSQAETLYRLVEGNLGIAYKFNENIVFGITSNLSDSQESIVAVSEQGTEIEVYNYRGETYSIKGRSTTVQQKVKKNGYGIGSQLYYVPSSKLELALKGNYSVSGTKILFPKGYLINVEDGFADFRNYDFNMKLKYFATKDLMFGVTAKYVNNNSWSKISGRDLLLWKWDLDESTFGAGVSYYFENNKLLIGLDYENNLVSADSNKYIDNRYDKLSSGNHLLKIGAEYEFLKNIFLRAGYNTGFEKIDIITGGNDVASHVVTLGCGINMKALNFDIALRYRSKTPNLVNAYSRNYIDAFAQIKLFTF